MASALRDRARAEGPPAPGVRRGPQTLRDRLRALPPRTRTVLALVVIVLTAAPVAASLARPDTLTSSFVVAQLDPSQRPERPLTERVGRTVFGAATRRRIARLRDEPGWSLSELSLDPITVSPGPRPASVRVTVPAGTAAASQDLARLVAGIIAAEGRRTLAVRDARRARLRELEAALERDGVPAAQRARLGLEATFVRRALPDIIPLRVSDPPVAASPTGLERLVERVDPSGAPRPNPLWAGAAGLVLGLALCTLWLVLRGRRS